MPSRPAILLLMGLSVLSCTFHCLDHQARAAAHCARYSGENRGSENGNRAESQGIDDVAPVSPADSEDESGCICRGAFFVEAPQIVPLEALGWLPLMEASTPLEQTFALEAWGEYLESDEFLLRPPLAGRTLRALVGSFLFSARSLDVLIVRKAAHCCAAESAHRSIARRGAVSCWNALLPAPPLRRSGRGG